MREGFVSDFKRFFLRGLAAVLPTMLTLMILIYVFRFVYDYIGRYINVGVLVVMKLFWERLEPKAPAEPGGPVEPIPFDRVVEFWNDYLFWLGFVLAIVAIYIFGRFVASWLGRGLWRMLEGMLLRAPLVRAIYPYVKQVTDFVFSERKIEFSRVVAVEYPRKGIWSLGLVTGAAMRCLRNESAGELLTVFIPSSPTPMTGYTIVVRREEVVDLPLSIDDALRFTISGGVIQPISQQLSDAEMDLARQGMFPGVEQQESQS